MNIKNIWENKKGEGVLKKVQIINSNNEMINNNINMLDIPSTEELDKLRLYTLSKLDISNLDEINIFLK